MNRRSRGLAAALAALAVLAAPAVSPAAAAGDGSAMFGLTPVDTPAPLLPAPAPAPVSPWSGLDSATGEAVLRALAQVAPPTPPAPAARPRARRAPRAISAGEVRARARAERDARRMRVSTDTTLVVRRGSRFELHNFGGDIAVATWRRDAVRIQAEHARRDHAEVRRSDKLLRVASVSPDGPAQSFEYRLTVPAWLPVSLSGVYNDVTAEGLEGGLEVETVRGDIEVKRAGGLIVLRSVEGLVDLADSKGTVRVSSVNDGVRLVNVSGDVQAEAVNGDIQLLDLASRRVEATTVNGAVLYDGRMFDDGSYRFSTHNGDIALALTDRSNATVTVSTHKGEFAAPFPVKLSRPRAGERFAFALGNGKAKVNVESFQGAIQLFKPGDLEVLGRFRESWKASERERVRAQKWIWKGNWDLLDSEDDADAADDAVPVGHGKRHKGAK